MGWETLAFGFVLWACVRTYERSNEVLHGNVKKSLKTTNIKMRFVIKREASIVFVIDGD